MQHPKTLAPGAADDQLPNSVGALAVEVAQAGLSLQQGLGQKRPLKWGLCFRNRDRRLVIEVGLVKVVAAAADIRKQFNPLTVRTRQKGIQKACVRMGDRNLHIQVSDQEIFVDFDLGNDGLVWWQHFSVVIAVAASDHRL